jgi:glycosyltransferase involved in cell wall biosynthesis
VSESIAKERMNVLLSAYACEPGKGSEPGVGWRWANGLASRVNLQVLTRESNRAAIEQAVTASPANDPLHGVQFHFHDLSPPWLWAKRRGLLPTLAYYALWQWSVARRFGKLADESDVVHHLTFCTLLCPGFWNLKRAAYVLGPVGAPQVNPHYLPLFGKTAWLQRLRGWVMDRFLHLPWLRRLLVSAAAVVPANSETRGLLVAHDIPARGVMLDTGAPEVPEPVRRELRTNGIRLIYAGQLERRKGLELSLRALARVTAIGEVDWSFDVLGSGPDRERLSAMAEGLGIANQVRFHGAVPQVEVMRHFQKADAFLFTSVRDTSGGVNLEAMAHGLPIICIAHQGVGDITDESCAERVQAGAIPATIDGLAAAIIRLASDPARRMVMGAAAAKRARQQFSWDEKFDRMCQYYRKEPVSESRSPSP